MTYANNLRATTVTMNDVASSIEGLCVPRNSLASLAARSTTAAATWELVPNTGVTVTLPTFCYVQQTFTLSASHNISGTLFSFTGARDSVANRPAYETYGKAAISDASGLLFPVAFTCLWKLAAGTYTFHIAWWNSAGSTAYTNISNNIVEVRRELIV